MSLRQRARAATDVQSHDEEYRQGLVSGNRTFDIALVNHLRSPCETSQAVYPKAGPDAYSCTHGEFAYTRAMEEHSRPIKRARTSYANGMKTENVSGVTSLNGTRLSSGIDTSTLSDEQLRNAVMNQITVLGAVEHDFKAEDAKSGRQYRTQTAGKTPQHAFYDMPMLSLVEVTAPLPSEVASGKFVRTGSEPDKTTLITRPVRGETLATELTTNVNWYLQNPQEFRAAMDPRVKSTLTWESSCQELFDHSMQNLVVGLDWLKRTNAYPDWPMVKDIGGGLREIEDGDKYDRSLNEAAHMFYAAVGFRDGVPAILDGTTVAARLKTLRARLRNDPASFAQAIALATEHVKALSVSPAVGAANAPAAIVDPRTIDFYSGGARSRDSAAAAARKTGGGVSSSSSSETFSFRQAFLRSAFFDGTSRRFMFGTKADGTNPSVDAATGKLYKQAPGGRIIDKQTSSFARFVATMLNVKRIQDSRIVGRVTRAAHRGQQYTLYMTPVMS